MIQYGTGRDLVGGDPDQVEAQKALEAQQAAAQAARESSIGIGVLAIVAAGWMYFQWRGKKGGK